MYILYLQQDSVVTSLSSLMFIEDLRRINGLLIWSIMFFVTNDVLVGFLVIMNHSHAYKGVNTVGL